MKNSFEKYEDILLNKLISNKKITVDEAMDLLNVSKSTVRRIFIYLESSGLAIRSYGSLQLASSNIYSFDAFSRKYSDEKSRIGKAACGFVCKSDIIFIDSGTTSMNFAFHLSQAIAKGKLSVSAIFTNSLATLDVLSPVATVNVIGGEYRSHRRDFYGYLSESVIRQLNFTKCFLGTDGVINNTDFAAMDFHTAGLNASVIDNSLEKFVLCDHSKFTSKSLVSWCPFSSIDTVISDTGLDDGIAVRIRKEGCALILA